MKVVITGGTGFIGSNLAEELSKEKDNEIIIVDDLSTGKTENLKKFNQNIKFVRGSITDLDLLKRTFKDCDYVFHQAAIPSVPRSIKDPIASNNANINGTLNVLVAAKSDAKGVYNIANGNRISINELADMILKLMGKNLKPVHDAPREGDVKHSLGDISRAKKDLGYEPLYSLEEGLRETMEWLSGLEVQRFGGFIGLAS